jgi:hypothetical protein
MVMIVCILFSLGPPVWILTTTSLVLILGLICAYQFDLMSKTAVILYDFDSEMEKAYDRIHDCASQIARCGGKWHVDARGRIDDSKYHGGAGELVRRKRISVGTGQPPFVKTNIAIPFIALGEIVLYFFPERLLLFAHGEVGGVSYCDLRITVSQKRFVEDQSVPRDARVVDRTWQFTNRDGGPDQRFASNRELPICLYEELWLRSRSGLNEVIQVSRVGIGQRLIAALDRMASMVTSAPTSARETVANRTGIATVDYAEAQRLTRRLRSLTFRRLVRRTFDLLQFGSGMAERMCVSLILAAMVFGALLGISVVLGLSVVQALLLAGIGMLTAFIPCAILVLGPTDVEIEQSLALLRNQLGMVSQAGEDADGVRTNDSSESDR